MNKSNRVMVDGLYRYDAVVVREGARVTPTIYTDWFKSDEAAAAGLREIMETQGYVVKAVRIVPGAELSEVENHLDFGPGGANYDALTAISPARQRRTAKRPAFLRQFVLPYVEDALTNPIPSASAEATAASSTSVYLRPRGVKRIQ
jgi:hypothetical protein